MDMGFTEIQQMLRTSAQEFLSRECPATLVREMEEDERGYPDELWRQIAGLGWAGVPFPEQYGGTGGDFLDLAVLLWRRWDGPWFRAPISPRSFSAG